MQIPAIPPPEIPFEELALACSGELEIELFGAFSEDVAESFVPESDDTEGLESWLDGEDDGEDEEDDGVEEEDGVDDDDGVLSAELLAGGVF